ncbi:hypothetical protein P885DRAFT_34661 [Corynascus similis CBS 632.67]
MPPPPPLLLTKRVTSFLRANLSPIIHSAMLTTPAGSLLAHASNLPASALRRQAAVAASLWALQGHSNAASTPADPATASLPPGSTVRTRKSGKHAQPTVTVQLDSGAVFVIRRLRCGMLFICMGGSEGAATTATTTTITTPPATQQQASAAGSPSQASVLSAHTTGAASTTSTATAGGSGNVSVMRRHVEELARWLDERLGGLCVPEEGIGIGIGSGNGVAAGYNSNHNVGGGGGHGAMNGAGNGLDVR